MKKYMNFDTEEVWTEDEIREVYDGIPECIDDYPTFENYLEYLLNLGRQKVGGIIEM